MGVCEVINLVEMVYDGEDSVFDHLVDGDTGLKIMRSIVTTRLGRTHQESVGVHGIQLERFVMKTVQGFFRTSAHKEGQHDQDEEETTVVLS